VQVVNLLNFDYEEGQGPQLCEEVLSTLTALLEGNDASRRRLVSDVGYDQILTAIMRQVGEVSIAALPTEHSDCLYQRLATGLRSLQMSCEFPSTRCRFRQRGHKRVLFCQFLD